MSEQADSATLDECPFCLAEKIAAAPVCPTCNRDTLPPAHLVAERDELLRHREVLRAEIDAMMKRLTV